MMNTVNVLALALLLGVSRASVISRKITDADGNKYDVMQINDADEDISIITKDGVVVEQQIVHQKEGYVIIKKNNTCSVEFYDEDEEKDGKCYSGMKPEKDEITSGMKKECGDMEIVFVRLGDCPDKKVDPTDHADGGIQKRRVCWLFRYIRLYCGWFGCYYRWMYYYRCY